MLLSGWKRNTALCLLAATALLSSCSSYTESVQMALEEQYITLTVCNWNKEREDVYWKIIEKFMEENPSIKVNYITYKNGYHGILMNSFELGTQPDLFAADGESDTCFKQYVERGYCYPLNTLEIPEMYEDMDLDICKWKNTLYMTPTAIRDTDIIYYNREIFEALGIGIPATWDEMMRACEILSENGITPFAMAGLSQEMIFRWFHAMCGAFDEEFNAGFPYNGYNFTNRRFEQMVQQITVFRDRHFFGNDYATKDSYRARLDFMNNESAMLVGTSDQYRSLYQMKGEALGTMGWPSAEGVAACWSWACDTSFCVAAATKHPAEALLLAEFLLSEESMRLLATEGGKLAGDISDIVEMDAMPFFCDRMGMYAKGNILPVEELQGCLQEALLGSKTPVDVAAVMQNTMDYNLIK